MMHVQPAVQSRQRFIRQLVKALVECTVEFVQAFSSSEKTEKGRQKKAQMKAITGILSQFLSNYYCFVRSYAIYVAQLQRVGTIDGCLWVSRINGICKMQPTWVIRGEKLPGRYRQGKVPSVTTLHLLIPVASPDMDQGILRDPPHTAGICRVLELFC